jgi:DNA polymerase-3 subunit epsilon
MLKNSKFSVVDIETTGFNHDGQKIIEIAIINYDRDTDQIEEVFSTLIYPETKINYQTERFTGINNVMVADAPKFYEIAKKIINMTENRILVAHNVFFDYRFIQREFNELGYAFRREVFCTCKKARVTFSGLNSYSLKNLCRHFGIKQNESHRALSDAENALAILKLIFQSETAHPAESEVASVDYSMPAQIENFSFETFPEDYGIYFMYSDANDLLYVGKSKNIRSRLKQHFKNFSGEWREKELKSRVSRVDFLRTYHDLPTSLLELYYIKNFKPRYNRAQRRKNFRYGVKKRLLKNGLLEITTTTVVDDVPIQLCFGNRSSVLRFIERFYENCFGFIPGELFYEQKLGELISTLGVEGYNAKLSAYLDQYDVRLEDKTIGNGDEWAIEIKDNQLKSITVLDRGKIEISETPDMRMVLLKNLSL